MANKPELIVMLTHMDKTVEQAYSVFEQCKTSKAQYWGIKEQPLPLEEMKKIFAAIREAGKTSLLEVVAYTEEEGLAGARLAVECGCDILMGTIFHDSINDFCQANQIKYMPFVGEITERPSILNGSIEGMVTEAKSYLEKGVYGIDLLGYRYTGDALLLNQTLVKEIDAPVCLAGSVDSFERLAEVKDTAPWSFTIGSAFFDQKFGRDIKEQINTVCDFMDQ